MEIINDIIRQLDRHAAKQYKVFANRASSHLESRKDFELFDLLRKNGGSQNEDRLMMKLYGREDRNAYYRLKNRLAEDIGLSLFIQQHGQHEHMQCHYLTSMGYYYFSRNQFKIALYYFRKAEKKAIESENYGLLDIIYSQMIKLARELTVINPEHYIKLRKENRTLQNRTAEVEDILEALDYRIKTSQNLNKNEVPVMTLLSQTLAEYTESDELRNSKKVQLGIYLIISRTLLQQQKYEDLENYLLETLTSFEEKKFFGKTNHHQKLQMLAWIANATYKNKKYSLSLDYAKKLHYGMEQYGRLHYDAYEFYYYNILVINYSDINPAKAVEVLLQMASKENIEKHAFNAVFIYVNLALCYFRQKEHKKGIESLNKLYRHWGYDTIDANARLTMYIGELMMRYEMKEYEFLEYRIKQILKENKEMLTSPDMASEKAFFALVGKMGQVFGNTRDKAIRQKIVQFLERFPVKENEEKNLFGYNQWLAGKL
jgi:hypothetical protein